MADTTFVKLGCLTKRDKRCYGTGPFGATLELLRLEKERDNLPDFELVLRGERIAVLWKKSGGSTWASGKPDGIAKAICPPGSNVYIRPSDPRYDPEDADFSVNVAIGSADEQRSSNGGGTWDEPAQPATSQPRRGFDDDGGTDPFDES